MNRIILAGLLLLAAGCAPESQAERPADERGAIYAALLDSARHHGSGVKLRHRYVQVETVPLSEPSEDIKQLSAFPEVTPDLLAAVRTAAAQPADVRALAKRPEIEWITLDSLARVAQPAGRDVSVISFSPPGISADGRRALVNVTHWCGARCGSQEWVLLERQPDGRWLTRRNVLTAIF